MTGRGRVAGDRIAIRCTRLLGCSASAKQTAGSKAVITRQIAMLLIIPSCSEFSANRLSAQYLMSLDHTIRPRQYVRRNGHADLLGDLEIDAKFETSRLFDRQLCWLSASEILSIQIPTPPYGPY